MSGSRRPHLGLARAARRATAPLRMLPTGLIIGAQKAGTTSLHRHLVQHPRIGRPDRKEVNYFGAPQLRSELWYRACFPVRGRYPVTIESSPSYLFHSHVPARVRGLLPEAKLIVLLRDPVDRAYSQYHHARAHGRETLEFGEALNREIGERDAATGVPDAGRGPATQWRSTYIGRGLYAEQLRRWYEHFPREQLLVLESERLFEDPAAVVGEVQDWLGLERHLPADLRAANTRSYAPLDGAAADLLREQFASDRRELQALTGVSFRWC